METDESVANKKQIQQAIITNWHQHMVANIA